MVEPEYEAEKILNFTYVNGIMQYKVKWAGYGEEEATWEPYDHLENCQHLIDDYFNALNLPRPPNIEPRFDNSKKGFFIDPVNPNHITISKERDYYYPFVFLKQEKPKMDQNFFCFSEGVDYENLTQSSPIEIIRIVRKDGKLFVVIRQVNKETYIAYETAVMLFPDALHSYLKERLQ